MKDRIRALAIGVGAMLIAAALIFAWTANRPGHVVTPASTSPSRGATLFTQRCGACHNAADLTQTLRQAPDRATRLREIEAFLGTHGDAPADEDLLIVGYLADRSK